MKNRKYINGLLATVMLAGCSSASPTAQPAGKYTAGTYTGTAQGMGSVMAEVTVDANEIKEVKLDLANETPSIGQVAGEELIKRIMETQGTEFDAISGATITTDAVKKAVEDALRQAEGKTASAIEDGTYTGSAHGSKSEITVEVEIKEGKITAVNVKEQDDSPYISDAAFNRIPDAIVENNSVAVDNVTGATLTSMGIKMAVTNALESSGADISEYEKSLSKEKTSEQDVDIDVLVVGGGASGLTAALAAKTDAQFSDTDSGLSVMVIESNGYAGGNLALCGGYVASYFGTPLNEATGISESADELVDELEAAKPQYDNVINDSLMRKIVAKNADVINGLMARGFYLSPEDAYAGVSTGLTTDGSPKEYTTTSVVAPNFGARSIEIGYEIFGGAALLADSLANAVTDAGVDLRLETMATELVMDGNAVTGVKVETPDSTYTINAKKVILATGYAGLDQDTVDRFLPAEYGNIINAQNSSNQSFAQKEVSDLGGDVVTMLEMGYVVPGYNTVLAHYGKEGDLYRAENAMWVNTDGERFMDETAPESGRGPEFGAKLLTQTDGRAWIIFDSKQKGVEYYDFLSGQGLAWKADTIEELAELAGLPSETLVESVKKYNSATEGDGDTEFGTAKENIVPITDGPFYAVKVGATSPAGIDVSVYGNENMQILLHKDGEPIENLYGAGGVVSNGYITFATIGLGTHVNASLLSGAYAGDCVREALLEK